MSDTSFLPEDYLERRAQRRTNIICLGLFVIVMGTVLAAFFVTDRQSSDVRWLQKQVAGQFEDAAKRIEQLDKLQNRRQQMIHKAQVTSVLVERVPRTLLMSELVNSMPMTLSLVDFNLETRTIKPVRPVSSGASALDKAKEARSGSTAGAQEPDAVKTEITVQVVGLAPTDNEVSQFMATLSQRAMFYDINLLFSEQLMVEERPLRRFRVEMKVNQDIDLRKYEPARVRRDLKFDPMAPPVASHGIILGPGVPGAGNESGLEITPGSNGGAPAGPASNTEVPSPRKTLKD